MFYIIVEVFFFSIMYVQTYLSAFIILERFVLTPQMHAVLACPLYWHVSTNNKSQAFVNLVYSSLEHSALAMCIFTIFHENLTHHQICISRLTLAKSIVDLNFTTNKKTLYRFHSSADIRCI